MIPEMAHMIAGGIGGTIAALITCPLEVVKVRLQATNSRVASVAHATSKAIMADPNKTSIFRRLLLRHGKGPPPHKLRVGVWQSIKLIVATEGKRGLFKGVGPTLVGVIPQRSIYFSSYTLAQSYFNELFVPDSSAVYFFSGALSSAISSTITNPIWFIKTRLQLDFGMNQERLTVMKIIRTTFQDQGLKGFYRGVTASYAGIAETGIHFMIYENLKVRFMASFYDSQEQQQHQHNTSSVSKIRNFTDALVCMGASMLSKTFATSLTYPHEVARTRLREPGNKYTGFFQTLGLVYRNEGLLGLYRGIGTHYMRQVPNTCIMMGVYEGMLLLFDRWGLRENGADSSDD